MFLWRFWNNHGLLRYLILLALVCWLLYAVTRDAGTWALSILTYTLGFMGSYSTTVRRKV